MKKREELKLRIAGIALGSHRFSIVCDKEFFEESGIEELQDGLLGLEINMEKDENMLDISFHFKGEVSAPCDRCLDPVLLNLDFEEHLLVKMVPFPGDEATEDEDIWIVDENIYELDLFHFVYEAIRLSLPTRVIHSDRPDGTSLCNPEMIKQLDELTEKDETVDPRWDALKNIKLD